MLTKISDQQIKAAVAKTPFFGGMTPDALDDLVKDFKPVYVRAGAEIIHEGDVGDSLYLVMNGRLRSIKNINKKNEIILGEISPGELIGEFALLTGGLRAASVIAVRDSVLLKLEKSTFLIFVEQHPLQFFNIAKESILRLLNPVKPKKNTITTIAVMPAGQGNVHRDFTLVLSNELAKVAPTLLLNRSTPGVPVEDELSLANWLSEQENNFRYIVYECDETDSAWTKLCLRQADQIISVAQARAAPRLNKIEEDIYSADKALQKKVALVLIHDPLTLQPLHTNRWLAGRRIDLQHHLKDDSLEGVARLVRHLTGRNIGLVLGGGGARGLAHIGAFKAIKELGIPIDLVGGTSAGAIIAALIAQDRPYDEIVEIARVDMANNRGLFDYTLPLISLLCGKSWRSLLQKTFGEKNLIEDLWLPFFCVSTNITKNRIELHRTGLLWKSIRASISLPAIVPPVSTDDGDLLIDGGVMNCMPVDIMQNIMNGGRVIALSATDRMIMQNDFLQDGELSGWSFLKQKLNPLGPAAMIVPNISEIVLETINLAGDHHQELMAKRADCFIQLQIKDFGLFDFKAVDRLIETGYRDTMEGLKDFVW